MKLVYALGLVAAAAFLFTTASAAQESKVGRSQLPPGVQQTVDTAGKGATVKGFAREVEQGQTLYEAQLTVNGHSKDMLMDSTGRVVEIEEQVRLADLQPAVRSALQGKAGKGRITTIESLTKRGRLVAYEAQVLTGKKQSEIQVGPNGEALKHEE